MTPIHILLVEDDPTLGPLIAEFLKLKGYEVSLSMDGVSSHTMIQKHKFQLCILDVMIPRLDGFELARKIKEGTSRIPIIFLTAKSKLEDIVQGFSLGADDYITKPFHLDELNLRIQAVLRRTQSDPENGRESNKHIFHLRGYIFDYTARNLIFGNVKQHLSTKEAELLRILCLYMNQLTNRSEALQQIWGEDSYYHARRMDVYISKLRKYLQQEPTIQILNVHGSGYKLLVPEE